MSEQIADLRFLKAFKQVHDLRYRLFLEHYANEKKIINVVEDFFRNLVDQSEFATCVRPEALKHIMLDNSFKTLIETGFGPTKGGKATRREVTTKLFGIDANSIRVDEFPKYGLLVSKNKVRDFVPDPDVFFHYGAVMVTFKKENLINRTTMTVGNSLDFGEYERKSPVFVNNPTVIATKNFFAFYEKIMDGSLSIEYPNHMPAAFDNALGFDCYELQFHGPLTFTNDVDRVEYFPVHGIEPEKEAELKAMLDERGVPYAPIIEVNL